MFGKKTQDKSARKSSGKSLAQYGLMDMNFDIGVSDGNFDDDGDDSDLENELLALSSEGNAKPKPPPRRKPVPQENLDAMVAESMRDVPSDDDISVDENDPDLLDELKDIAGSDDESSEAQPQPTVEIEAKPSISQIQAGNSNITLLQERLKMYQLAEAHAKESGETSRARRFGRGIKTLKDLLKQATSGKPINSEDIPPEVSLGEKQKQKTETGDVQDPSVSSTPLVPEKPATPVEEPQTDKLPSANEAESSAAVQIDENLLATLKGRQNQYKVAALKAKKGGDNSSALNFLKIAKQFDHVISAVQSGQSVDLSGMPGPPTAGAPKPVQNEVQTHEAPQISMPENVEDIPEQKLITASSLAEALEQRLEIYKAQEAQAKEQQNTSKARRMGRIVKQFQQAITLNKAGKPVPLEDLPTPPGYAPLPGSVPPPAPPSASSLPGVTPSPKPSSASSVNDGNEAAGGPRTNKSSPGHTTRISGNRAPNSRAEKQMQILLAKQKEFKEAALKAKRKGEITQAKEFLRTAKGFDKLIDASSCGLPVDLSTLPVSPDAKSHLEEEYHVVMADEFDEEEIGDADVITRLETQLGKQLKMCLSTRDHHKALGDVAGMNKFERMALSVTNDLDVVRTARRCGSTKPPKFHYENRDFSVVKSFTELGDNDLELSILRGINYSTQYPKDIDTYVKFEFPYPQETPYSDKTSVVKNTNNPEYNATFTIPIQRTVRACQRVFKRHSIKLEVYSKGCWCASNVFCCFSGFLRSDTLIGTANVKLQHLETQCEVHDSFDLLEGRKKIGGKLEVKLRLRHPIVTQEVEQLHEKWLVIDH